jgi:hypothetical protein
MIQARTDKVPALPVQDYQSAVARAVRWLGDRYLLATPVNAPRQRSAEAVRRP